MEYDVYLRREAMDFLRKCRPHDRDHLLRMLDVIANDPFKSGDFTERDISGRDIQGWVSLKFAILYWPDHFAKEVRVAQIRLADR